MMTKYQNGNCLWTFKCSGHRKRTPQHFHGEMEENNSKKGKEKAVPRSGLPVFDFKGSGFGSYPDVD